MPLDEIRKDLDGIDSQLIELFAARMAVIEQVTELKKAEGLPFFYPDREKDVIERAAAMVPSPLHYYAASFMKYLLELSGTRQREIINKGRRPANKLTRAVENAVLALPHPRVTVQGVEGSYASLAAASMYPNGEITSLPNWEDVLYAVTEGSCDYGVLPVENSAVGSVNEVYDLLIKYKHYIVKALPLAVEHCLLGVRGAKITDIRRVYSHPHAFPQCTEFLRKHYRMQRNPNLNTAMAAEFVSHEGKFENAAIASKDCAHIYGLDVLAESIQNSDCNVTRFISVSKRLEVPDNANKISLVFTLPHVTGSLYRTLSRFALNGLNLTKLESRPNPQKNFEYFFYLDFTGKVKSDAVLNLLTALSEELPMFCFLGNYFEP